VGWVPYLNEKIMVTHIVTGYFPAFTRICDCGNSNPVHTPPFYSGGNHNIFISPGEKALVSL